ncbi:MAG: GNAT family N-acetyltransferase [Micromonosporaceae bacterium]
MTVLQTRRLLLRPWDEADLDEFVRLATDPRVVRHIGTGTVWDAERIRERHRGILDHWDQYGYGWRIAVDRADGSVVGLEALNRLGARVPGLDESYVEIGWWFAPRVWGRGLAGEGAVVVRDEAFTRLAAECVVGRYQPANEASGRIMDRLGMTDHGTYVDDAGITVAVKTMHREQWRAATEGDAR